MGAPASREVVRGCERPVKSRQAESLDVLYWPGDVAVTLLEVPSEDCTVSWIYDGYH